MKVLFCDNSLKMFLNFRGDVVKSLYLRGCETIVVVPEHECTDVVLRTAPSYLRVIPVRMSPNGTSPVNDSRYILSLFGIYRQEKPDVIFHYTIKPNTYGGIVAGLLKIPFIDVVTGMGYIFNSTSLMKKQIRKLYLYVLGKAHKVITLNEANTKALQQMGLRKLHMLKGGEGVNLTHFSYRKNNCKRIVFLFVGRVLYDKGYVEYVSAATIIKKKYPDVRFEILGPTAADNPMGIPESRLRKDIDSGAIAYLGVTDDVIPYLEREGVVVVVCSYHEGMNRSLMEACAVGRPCIASNIPGCKEIVDDGINGYLAEPKSVESLVASMEKYINLNCEEKLQMGYAARKKAEEIFNIDDVCKEYDLLISEIVTPHGR